MKDQCSPLAPSATDKEAQAPSKYSGYRADPVLDKNVHAKTPFRAPAGMKTNPKDSGRRGGK